MPSPGVTDRGAAPARLVFVPGMKPKPPPGAHARLILRVLGAALSRVRPGAARLLEEHPERFTLIAWTYRFYQRHRDTALDAAGVERLLANPEPSAADTAEIDALARRLSRLLRFAGDALPLLGRLVARRALRLTLTEVHRYFADHDGLGSAIRGDLARELAQAAERGERVLLVAHSLGSVIAYETLWELTQVQSSARVDLFVTLGSPLASRFIRRRLAGARLKGAERYPGNVRRWVNFSAKGDDTALHPRLRPFFGPMLELGLLESLEDHTGLYNHYRSEIGLNVHDAYGYLAHPLVASVIGDWLEGRL